MVKKLKLKQLTIKPENRKISTYFSIFSNFVFFINALTDLGHFIKKKIFCTNIKKMFYKYMDRPGTLL